MTTQDRRAARPRVVWLLLCLGVAAVLFFAGTLRFVLRTAFVLDASNYALSTPEDFRFQCAVAQSPGAFVLEGWAFREGERFLTVNTSAVLYDTQTGVYRKLPTALQLNEGANAAVPDGTNYSFGGFYAFVREKQLEAPYTRYEICIAYRANSENALVHTGQLLEVSP